MTCYGVGTGAGQRMPSYGVGTGAGQRMPVTELAQEQVMKGFSQRVVSSHVLTVAVEAVASHVLTVAVEAVASHVLTVAVEAVASHGAGCRYRSCRRPFISL